jgi:hypothetical protein
VSPEDVANAERFDINQDGFLTREELKSGRRILMRQFYDRNVDRYDSQLTILLFNSFACKVLIFIRPCCICYLESKNVEIW